MPWDIDRITHSRACEYIEQLNKRQNDVHSTEVCLAEIKTVLFAWFGIKDEPQDIETKLASSGMPVNSVPKEAFDAWVKAGMPSPPEKFFKAYGRSRRNSSKDRGSDKTAKS